MKYKILIIEDEEVLLNVLSKKIEKRGYEVITALDGEKGLKRIRKDKPDLILLDIVMPKMNGYDVLQAMKDFGIKIPVVIISNSGQPVDIQKALYLGACDYIVKAELNPDEIIEKIEHCLGVKSQAKDKKDKRLKSKTDSVKASQSTKLKKGKVLIVEDDFFLRQLCEKSLKETGYHVDTAIDGVTALKKIVNNKPDLVLLDIIMPGLEGFKVLKKVRAHKNQSIAKIPIIILSNLGQDADIKKGLELGANDYLIKANFTMDEIVKKAQQYLI